jgi:alcohol dehydrogenase, propanol-preferring
MRAMLLSCLGSLSANPTPLELTDLPVPTPAPDELLIRVSACGVCHTELDEIEGRTPPPRLPVIPGHQAVGHVVAMGVAVSGWQVGDRAGAAWIYSSCGHCTYCLSSRENLCADFRATGRDANGGYTEYMVIPAAYAHPIPSGLSDTEAAPFLCAGAVGYRALALSNLQDGQRLGLVGFGASAHLVLLMAKRIYPHSPVYVISRSVGAQADGRRLGADWSGSYDQTPPALLDAVIDTTPAWRPVLRGLELLAPGGRLVINAISKEDADREALMGLDYARHLWLEHEIKSVANVTRADVRACLKLAAEANLRPEVVEYPLEEANRALLALKSGGIRGSAVLRVA